MDRICWFASVLRTVGCLLLSQSCLGADSGYYRQVEKTQSVIVFVHGLWGDPKSSWTGNNNAYLPELIASDDYFKPYDIYVYGYQSSFSDGRLSIDEVAEDMRVHLDSDGVSSHREIIFLTHSMGGLVTRAYLLKNRKAAEHTRMIYFYSTPTTGAQIASWAKLIATLFGDNTQLSKLVPMVSEDFLEDQQRQWLSAGYNIPSYCAYEKLPTDGVLVVPQASASNLCNRRLDPLVADHITIVKPNSVRDPRYMVFKSAVEETPGFAEVSAREPMDEQQAYNVLDRARHLRDYTDTGQVTAIESLIIRGKSVARMDLSGLDLTGIRITKSDLSHISFNSSILERGDLSESSLNDTSMNFSTLTSAIFDKSKLYKSRLLFSLATKSSFSSCDCRDVDFTGANLDGADFTGADLNGANFTLSSLKGVKFDSADMKNAYLIRADLQGASFKNVIFSNTDVTEAVGIPEQLLTTKTGLCKTPIEREDVNVLVIERIPSSSFDGGVEHYRLYETSAFRKSVVSETLPRCNARKDVSQAGPIYALRDEEVVNGEISFSFSQEFLSAGDRAEVIPTRIQTQLKSLGFEFNY